jgi:medium-chain acyl-[acyl-carrier-protein] hydrolase
VVSGRRGPAIPSRRRVLFGLPDDEFLAEVVRLGGMPREIVAAPDLIELLLPVLRADYELSETYRRLPGERLACPIAAYMGAADPEVDHDGLRGWRQETSGEFVGRVFSGDHFYLKSARPDVLRAVLTDLREATSERAPASEAEAKLDRRREARAPVP